MGFRIRRFGNDKQTGCVLVNTMDKPKSRIANIIIRIVAEMPCESIDKRTRIVSVTGMHHKSGRFVDDEQRIILIHDVKRDILRDDFKFITRTVHHYLYRVKRLDTIV